ncbi:MAG: site-2 protease family protein [Alphaproteobacteria bacterium]|nr:site-2 protease family protein [Alphaproteobacteria bacterium]
MRDVVIFAAVILSIMLHEIAHGYAAYRCGDDTALKCGRLSLNPIRHIDWFGSVFLPCTLLFIGSPFVFGWAKPVPVDFLKLRKDKIASFMVASAGIFANMILAFSAMLILQTFNIQEGYIETFLISMVITNTILIAFNILPIPPLDGSKIFFGWIDKTWAKKYVMAEKQGLAALIVIVALLPVLNRMIGVNAFDPFGWYIEKIMSIL